MSGLRMHYYQSLLRQKNCRHHRQPLSSLVWSKPIFMHHPSQQQQQHQRSFHYGRQHATATISTVTRTKSSHLHPFRFPFSSSSFGRDSYHSTHRGFSAFSSNDANKAMVKSQNKLVLGSHKWSSMDPVHYCEIVQTALANGITTIEAGQGPGALQALHKCLSQMQKTDQSINDNIVTQPPAIRILQRVGYRTTLRLPPPPPPPPPASLENEDGDDVGLDDHEKQQQSTTPLPTPPPPADAFSLLPGDVIVEEVPVSAEAASSSTAKPVPGAPRASSKTSTKTTSFPAGSTTVVLHNISAAGIQEAMSTSPFLTEPPLTLDVNQKVETVFMLHNPEAQGGATVGQQQENSKSGLILPKSSSDITNKARQEAICARLVESFVALEMAVQHGQIASYGIVSNGLGLPHDHPLHLSWQLAIRPALERAFQNLNNNDNSDSLSSSANGPSSSAAATPRRLLHFSILELPINLIETTGLQVARQVHKDLRQDGEFRSMFANKAIEIYAMRPLSAYPDLGTGQNGHALVLADYLLPTLTTLPNTSTSGVAGGVVGGEVAKTTTEESINGGPPPPPRMQWSHTMSSPPEIYNIALQSAMAHFDAEAILEAQQERLAQGEKADLTAEERETLDGCKLMQSLLHDVDIGLDKMRCFAVHERELMQRIIPLIYDTFEEYDDDTAKVLQTFFAAYTLAVRYAIAKNTRHLLLHGEDSLSDSSNIPIFKDLHPDMKLQEYAIDFILKQQLETLQGPRETNGSNDVASSGEAGKAAWPTANSKDVIDKLVVGCTDPDQVIDDLELVYQFYFRKMQEEKVAATEAEAKEEG